MPKEEKVRLYSPELDHYESFGRAHAERILNYSDVWELADQDYEFVNYELRRKENTGSTPKPKQKAVNK